MKFIPNESVLFKDLKLGDAFWGKQRGGESLYVKARVFGNDGEELAVDLLTGIAYKIDESSFTKPAKVHIVED